MKQTKQKKSIFGLVRLSKQKGACPCIWKRMPKGVRAGNSPVWTGTPEEGARKVIKMLGKDPDAKIEQEYKKEWEGRFRSGHPKAHMDRELTKKWEAEYNEDED